MLRDYLYLQDIERTACEGTVSPKVGSAMFGQ